MSNLWPHSPWVRAIFGFFLVVLLMQISLLYTAFSAKPELIVEDPYEKGLDYQSKIELLESSSKLNWMHKLEFGAVSEQGLRTITLNLGTKDGKAVSGADVELIAKRLSAAEFDVRGEFVEDPSRAGTYQAKLQLPLDGLWYISLRIEYEGEEFIFEQKEFL